MLKPTGVSYTNYFYFKVYFQISINPKIFQVLQIVGGRNTSTIEGPHATDWLYALECVDSFNKVRCYVFTCIPPRVL